MAITADSAGATMHLLQHIGTISERQFDQALLEQFGIGTSQYRILLVLQAHSNISQRRLATNLGQTEASISRQVRVLQAKSLIVVSPHPKSRRERVVTLSSKGIAVIEAAHQVFSQIANDLLGALNERQQKSLSAVLGTLHTASCAPDVPRSCDHELELLMQHSGNAAYVLAIS